MLRRFPRLPLLTAALTLTACEGLTGIQEIYDHRLVGIAVEQGLVVEIGDTVRVTAAGDVGGVLGMLVYDPLPDARWSVADPSIARLEALPPPPPEDSFPRARTLIRGVRPGETRITAMARGVSGQATVRVVQVISTIILRPARDTVSVGDTIRLRATAVDARGTIVDGLRFTFAADGAQLYSYDGNTVRVVAVTPGALAISARFRRALGEAALVVVPRAAGLSSAAARVSAE